MRWLKTTFLAIAFSCVSLQVSHASVGFLTLDTVSNYQGWGWEALLVQNQHITLAIVPSIGARVLQYDLATDTFMIVNESLLGETFYSDYPTPYSTTWGYGGYKTWPAPQSEWNWTPPPVMAWGNYEYKTLHASADSVVIRMKGQTEQYQTPGLRFDRYITAYSNSTRVKVTTVLFNDNAAAESWSIWDVTQTIVQHESLGDFSNFAAYIPIESASDIWDNGGGPAYEEVLPGIYKLQYSSQEGKMFSKSSEGWTCWVDERDEQCYAKLFEVVEGADYPDDGANVEYYTNGNSRYMEMEVLGPIEEIGPDGADSIVFVEDWYVASSGGPVYTANHAGIVLEPFSYNRLNQSLTGVLAAFTEGSVKAVFETDNGSIIGWVFLDNISPAEKTVLDAPLAVPESTRYIHLNAYDGNENFIASMASLELINEDSFTAYKVPETPTIDGVADEAFWDTTSWYSLDYVWLPYNDLVDPEDFTGRFKLAWDENLLYMLVEVVDDSLYDSHPEPLDNYWNDDCVEVFLDEDHSGGDHLSSYNAFAYHVSTEFDVVDNNASGSTSLFNDHIDAARTVDGDTYTWELAIRVFDDSYSNTGSSTPVTLEHAKELGFSLAYCDTDGSPQRENFIGSKYLEEAVSNNSYINASLFGTLTLIDPEGGSPPDIILTQKDEYNIRLYPNPATETLFFRFEESLTMDCPFQLRSITGQLVGSGIIRSGEHTGRIDINGLAAGMYILDFVSDQVNVSKRVIIR
ncbi:MAG: T9SS type A sorting domain-containing protein [Bacteroidales bacterium]|nr:T9SS type A sorting domain-containing protein [Bacteroidales bacterium]